MRIVWELIAAVLIIDVLAPIVAGMTAPLVPLAVAGAVALALAGKFYRGHRGGSSGHLLGGGGVLGSAREALILVILLAIAVHVLWAAIEPMIGYIIVSLVLAGGLWIVARWKFQ